MECILASNDASPFLLEVLEVIAHDEIARRISHALKTAMRDEPRNAQRFPMPTSEADIRQKLLSMDPYLFESHVVSFFKADGVKAWVTKKSNDFGVDGFVAQANKLFVIQCKRNSSKNTIGSPVVQQFKGVIEENGADRGYLVTTSTFTPNAIMSAKKSDKFFLVDMDRLVQWHVDPPVF